MATFPPKGQKSQNVIEPVWVVAYIAAISILMTFGFRINMRYISFNHMPDYQSHAYVSTAAVSRLSFASDESYWNTHCGHSWAKDATCQSIMLKAQSCEINSGSAYCSDYQEYLRHDSQASIQ